MIDLMHEHTKLHLTVFSWVLNLAKNRQSYIFVRVGHFLHLALA